MPLTVVKSSKNARSRGLEKPSSRGVKLLPWDWDSSSTMVYSVIGRPTDAARRTASLLVSSTSSAIGPLASVARPPSTASRVPLNRVIMRSV